MSKELLTGLRRRQNSDLVPKGFPLAGALPDLVIVRLQFRVLRSFHAGSLLTSSNEIEKFDDRDQAIADSKIANRAPTLWTALHEPAPFSTTRAVSAPLGRRPLVNCPRTRAITV